MAQTNTVQAEQFYHTIGQKMSKADSAITISQMFGKPCLKINSKAFVCFFHNEMVFKLGGVAHGKALKILGTQLFDPSGKKRPMKEWVQVPFKYSKEWGKFAKEALAYVGGKSK